MNGIDEVFSNNLSNVVKDEYHIPNKNRTDVNNRRAPKAPNNKVSPLPISNDIELRESPTLNDKERRESPCSSDRELSVEPILNNDKETNSPRESPQNHGPDTKDFVHVDMDLNKCETPFQRQDTIIKDQLFEMFGMDSHGNMVMHDIYEDVPLENHQDQDSIVHQGSQDSPALSSQNVDGEFLI